MKNYVPTLESYSAYMMIFESPDDIVIASGYANVSEPQITTVSRDYDKAYPFLVMYNEMSDQDEAKIANMPGDHFKLAIQLAPKMGIDQSQIGKTPLSDIAKDAGRIFIFGEKEGFVIVTFYGASNKSGDIDLSGMIFTKTSTPEESSIQLVAQEVKRLYPNYSIYLDQTETKEKPIEPKALLGSPEFKDQAEQYYTLAAKASYDTISLATKEPSIGQFRSDTPKEFERPVYAKRKEGTMRSE